MLSRGRLAFWSSLLLFSLSALVANPAHAQKKVLCVHGLDAPAKLIMRSGSAADSSVVLEIPAKSCGLTLSGRCIGKLCQMTYQGWRGWVDTASIGVYEVPAGSKVAD